MSVMDVAERDRRRICHSVTDAQARALVVLRLRHAEPGLMFSRERWTDGVRVVELDGAPVVLLDADGEPVPWGV
jgi:hypothetical protein